MNSYLDKIIDQTVLTVEADKRKISFQEIKSYISDLDKTNSPSSDL